MTSKLADLFLFSQPQCFILNGESGSQANYSQQLYL